jgi:LCP family protein required for cell wall assembly
VTLLEPHPSRRARRDADRQQQGAPGHRRQLPVPAEQDTGYRRGSHATPGGQGFSWVLSWTIAGALLPGLGLVAAGWRRLGMLLLTGLALVAVAVAAVSVVDNPIDQAMALAVDPQKLLIAAGVLAAAALLWITVILLTHSELRRYAALTRPQRLFSGLVVTALVVGVAVPAYQATRYALIQRDLVTSVFTAPKKTDGAAPDSQKVDPWASIPQVNVLLIGSDAGRGREGTRPDTLILASIDTKTGDTVLFSLPRNLERVPFPIGTPGAEAWPNGYDCGSECLLNAIWRWAETDGRRYYRGPNPGLQATEDAVAGTLGLRPDYYAMLNLKGFQQFIDAIGGLRVNIAKRLPINGSSTNPGGTTAWLEPGRNVRLNGFETLWYARSRWSTDDYDRMRRQRCVIGAVTQQADPLKLARAFPKIAKAAKTNLSTDIPLQDLEAWVELTQRVKQGSVRSLPFTDQVISSRVNPDYAQIRSLVNQALRPPTDPTPSAGAGASAGASAGSATVSASATPKAKKKKVDPLKAQDITSVC